MDAWLQLPRWIRAVIALSILAPSVYLLIDGWFWGWGWAIGGSLLVLSLPRPLGPPPSRGWSRRKDDP